MRKILITSIGRTATLSLSKFLNTFENVQCFHEKERQDVPLFFLSQIDQFSNLVKGYFEHRNTTVNNLNCSTYIEVNPYFRFVDETLLKSLGWRKIGVVRHPKTYLESVFVRKLFTESDVLCSQFPDNSDAVSATWHTLSRFQKLCWYYGEVHEYFLKSNLPIYRFEDLVGSSSHLKNFVSDMGLPVSEKDTWKLPKHNTALEFATKQKIASIFKKERSESPSLNWKAITPSEMDFYQEYCVNPAKKLGYAIQ
ncbi:hypothetical protein [Marixanthomonas spongiae]|uniref:Sulfotransferase domain-containing protein n=1 Tax=Marixanthomonas spongiae TaxID=2174845 RepID=A0A2U0I3W7_9FLAO|nr:hypothetical protein [Marixanthomonas spongiae]PVW15764.1 hypothetical protein DDV96_05710 [Marixanthomonas spongiae]